MRRSYHQRLATSAEISSTPVNEIVKQSSDPLLIKHDSWERVLLADLAEVLNGFAFKSSHFSKEHGTPLIRIRDVGKDTTDVLYNGPYEERYVIETGDLLIGMDGDFNSARWKGSEALLNQRVCKVELKSEHYSPGFLEYVLPGYLKAINDKTSAVTVKHLSSRSVKEIPLPLPPLNEQRRVVEKIEELFTKLDAGVRSLKQAQAQLKSYRRSVLKAAVEGELSRQWREAHRDALEPASELLERILQERREKFAGKKYKEPDSPNTSELPVLPSGWVWASADQLTTVITDGEHITPERSASGVPLLSARNVQNGRLSFEKVDYVPESVYEILTRRLLVEPGDVLMSCSGTVGRSCVAPENSKFALVRSVAVLKPLAGMGAFLSYSLRSPLLQEQIHKKKTQTAQANIFQGKIRTLVFALPPLEEQRFIVEEVERRLSVVDKLEATVEANLKQADGLRQSILKQAFSGALVPQGPDDEPASVLLERIREERQATKQKAGKKNVRAKKAPESEQDLELFPEQGV